jgi:hypothetical protein
MRRQIPAQLRIRRLRFIFLVAGLLTLAVSANWLWDGPLITKLRASFWMWYNNYEGCTCSDCAPLFGNADFTRVSWQTHVPFLGFGDRDDLGLIAGAYGCCLLLTAAFGGPALARLSRPRKPDPTKCASCGYARDGLAPSGPCPECGRSPEE